MIFFVDLRPAGIPGVRFAFWDTVRDRFVEANGAQGWETMREFEDDCYVLDPGPSPMLRDECIEAAPSWASNLSIHVAFKLNPDDQMVHILFRGPGAVRRVLWSDQEIGGFREERPPRGPWPRVRTDETWALPCFVPVGAKAIKVIAEGDDCTVSVRRDDGSYCQHAPP